MVERLPGFLRGILICLGLGSLLGACSSAADERALAEFERLAFVPAGECTLVPREHGISLAVFHEPLRARVPGHGPSEFHRDPADDAG